MTPLTRLMAHYPIYDAQQKAVVLGDVCAEVVTRGISLCAVVKVCHETWTENIEDAPRFPKSGQLLKGMTDRMGIWQEYYDSVTLATEPKRAIPAAKEQTESPYGGRKWPDFTAEDKSRLAAELKPFPVRLQAIFRRLYDVPDEIVFENGEAQ